MTLRYLHTLGHAVCSACYFFVIIGFFQFQSKERTATTTTEKCHLNPLKYIKCAQNKNQIEVIERI